MRIRWRILACLCLGGLLVWFLADAGPCGTVWRKLWPSVPFRGPLPVPLPGGLLSAAGSGVRGAGRPLAGGADGAAVPGPRRRHRCAGAGVGGGLPHRRQDGSRPLPGKSGLPGGGGAAAGLLQQLQSGVPHQCVGRGGVRQCAGRGVAVADPCALHPSDGTGVSGQRKIRFPAGTDKAPPFQAVSFAEAFTGAVRSSLAGILSVCAFVVFFYVLAQPLTAVGGPPGGGPGGGAGALLPDAPADS